MKAALTLISAVVLVASIYSVDPGIVGIRLDNTDFRIVAHVAPNSPAARAGIRTGDRIIAVDGYLTSYLHNAEEFSSRADGAAGTELELQLQREGALQPLIVRMRRVPMSTIDLSERWMRRTYPDGHVEVIDADNQPSQFVLLSMCIGKDAYRFTLLSAADFADLLNHAPGYAGRPPRGIPGTGYLPDISALKKSIVTWVPAGSVIEWRGWKDTCYPPKPVVDEIQAFACSRYVDIRIIADDSTK